MSYDGTLEEKEEETAVADLEKNKGVCVWLEIGIGMKSTGR